MGRGIVLDYKRESTLLNAKRDRKNLPNSDSLHSMYMSQGEPADGISAGHAKPVRGPNGDTRRALQGPQIGPLRAMCALRLAQERDTPTKELLDETTNAGKVDRGRRWRIRRGGKSTGAELVGDSADEAVDHFEPKHDVG